MSLRAKLLLLFGVLGVAPLLFVGVFDYVHAMRTVEAHLAGQNALIAEPLSRAMGERIAGHHSDLALLAENTETLRLLAASRSSRLAAVRDSVQPYFDEAWRQFAPWYTSIELRESGGPMLLRLGSLDPLPVSSVINPAYRSEREVVDPGSGAVLGTVMALVRTDALLPSDLLASRYGERGYNLVVDRSSGRILYHPRYSLRGQPLDSLPAGLVEAIESASPDPVSYRQGDTARVAFLSHFESPAWTLVTSSSRDEFAAPFVRMRRVNLALVGALIAIVSIVSMLLIRRETRSLAQLTAAADRVGQGDFSPDLPPPGQDEVGRLSAAFRAMTTRVREMMAQVEASRQMAAIGEFAAEIAHEIRNPLTSVKLNLQRIRRVEDSGFSTAAAEPLAISLREIDRLESVVRGVLDLGRHHTSERHPQPLAEILDEAVDSVRSQAERNGVALELSCPGDAPWIRADSDRLRGAFVNLLQNGVEAMPTGGTLRVQTDLASAGSVVVRIADSGPGIPAAARDQVFRPFFTTKPAGTGLGLAIAVRAIHDHGGRLAIEDPSPERGARFRVELPVAPTAVEA
jgi:signal transduction histidine kinase